MIETFFDREDENAHAGFQRWRAHHWGDGYFINYKSPNNVMLHRSPCPHLGDTDWARFEQGLHRWHPRTVESVIKETMTVGEATVNFK